MTIGDHYGLSRERIRQIEAEALVKLRKELVKLDDSAQEEFERIASRSRADYERTERVRKTTEAHSAHHYAEEAERKRLELWQEYWRMSIS